MKGQMASPADGSWAECEIRLAVSFGCGVHLNSSGPVQFAAVQPPALPSSLVWLRFRTTTGAVLPADSSHGRRNSVGSAVLISGATRWMRIARAPSLRVLCACCPVSPAPRRPLVACCLATASWRPASRSMVSTTTGPPFPVACTRRSSTPASSPAPASTLPTRVDSPRPHLPSPPELTLPARALLPDLVVPPHPS